MPRFLNSEIRARAAPLYVHWKGATGMPYGLQGFGLASYRIIIIKPLIGLAAHLTSYVMVVTPENCENLH